jgi:hypothetical protein
MTPTARTIQHLAERDISAGNVERYVHQVRKRYDLFGFIDVIAIYPESIAGLQITSGSNVASRVEKIMTERRSACADFLRVGVVEVWGWRRVKLKRGGAAIRWKPRVLRASLSRGQIIWVEIDV